MTKLIEGRFGAARVLPDDEDLQPLASIGAPWAKHLRDDIETDAPEAPPSPEAVRAAAIDRRLRWIRGAGPVDPDAAEGCAAALDACPRVKGHPGSDAAASAVERFVREARLRTLTLLGGAGRGKSWAATWAVASAREAMWLPANEIRVPTWDEHRARAIAASLLVVDDLGREPNDWAQREACDLVESRHNRGARTVLTSNLPMRLEDIAQDKRAAWKGRTLAERYGDRFTSRLQDVRLALVVRCGGDDLRRATTTTTATVGAM